MNALRFHKRLDAPIPELPELNPLVGKDIEIIAMEGSSVAGATMEAVPATAAAKPIGSLDDLRSRLPGDPFGPDFEKTIRQWREEPWRDGDADLDK
jgi:hypothetical protein